MTFVQKKFAIAAIFAVLLALILAVFISTASGEPNSSRPTTLTGNWHQTNVKNSAVNMTAKITNSSIQIDMQSPDGSNSGIYWLGTFNGNRHPAGSFTLVSKADQDALKWAIFGSQDTTKSFKYKNGVLSYKFTMMGKTTTIRLAKDKKKSVYTTKYPTPTATTYKSGGKVSTTKPKPVKTTKAVSITKVKPKK
jgi:hypothetical protein